MQSKLSGKVAVVTAPSKRTRAEIARQLAAEGASVVVKLLQQPIRARTRWCPISRRRAAKRLQCRPMFRRL